MYNVTENILYIGLKCIKVCKIQHNEGMQIAAVEEVSKVQVLILPFTVLYYYRTLYYSVFITALDSQCIANFSILLKWQFVQKI